MMVTLRSAQLRVLAAEFGQVQQVLVLPASFLL
jgi:hypothetical protein